MLIHQDGTTCTGSGCSKKIHNNVDISKRALNDVTNLSKTIFAIAEPINTDDPSLRNSRDALHLSCLMFDTAVALVLSSTDIEPLNTEKFDMILKSFLEALCQATQ